MRMDGTLDAPPHPPTDAAGTVVRPGTARRTRRERRPTGAPPPLPRNIGASGKLWLGLITYVAISCIVFLRYGPFLKISDQVDTWWLQQVAVIRTPWLTHVM